MIIVTGGAGFIGSCIVRELNNMGHEDIIIVDNIQKTEKWKNMRNKRYIEYISRNDFLDRLPEFAGKVSHVIHMGACSATTELDFDFYIKIILSTRKHCGNFVQKINVLLFMPAVQQPMELESSALMIKWILRNCCL